MCELAVPRHARPHSSRSYIPLAIVRRWPGLNTRPGFPAAEAHFESQNGSWTQFEAWLSMQKVTEHGLMPAPEGERRYTIVPIYNGSTAISEALVTMWANKTPEEAHSILALDDVVVTNKKDKERQLRRLMHLDEEVKSVMRQQAQPPPPPLARSLSRGLSMKGSGLLVGGKSAVDV